MAAREGKTWEEVYQWTRLFGVQVSHVYYFLNMSLEKQGICPMTWNPTDVGLLTLVYNVYHQGWLLFFCH